MRGMWSEMGSTMKEREVAEERFHYKEMDVVGDGSMNERDVVGDGFHYMK